MRVLFYYQFSFYFTTVLHIQMCIFYYIHAEFRWVFSIELEVFFLQFDFSLLFFLNFGFYSFFFLKKKTIFYKYKIILIPKTRKFYIYKELKRSDKCEYFKKRKKLDGIFDVAWCIYAVFVSFDLIWISLVYNYIAKNSTIPTIKMLTLFYFYHVGFLNFVVVTCANVYRLCMFGKICSLFSKELRKENWIK